MSAIRTDDDDTIARAQRNPRYLNSRYGKSAPKNESFAMFSMLKLQVNQRSSDSDEAGNSDVEDDSEPKARSTSKLMLTIAITFVISICTSVVIALSKLTLVSITGRVFSLSNLNNSETADDDQVRTVLWTQLILLMIIPEAITVLRCLTWGIIGKSWKSFPCPDCKVIAVVSWLYVALCN